MFWQILLIGLNRNQCFRPLFQPIISEGISQIELKLRAGGYHLKLKVGKN